MSARAGGGPDWPHGSLLADPLAIATVGAELFASDAEAQGAIVERVAWDRPDDDVVEALATLALDGSTAAANDAAAARMLAARPELLGVATAAEVVPGMERNTLLHAGPPIGWSELAGPLRGAVVGAMLYEGLASTPEAAERKAAAGEVELAPCHERSSVGPMAGVVSASMPVWVIEDATHGQQAYCTFNEGLGKVLRYGANDGEVLDRLRWLRDVLRPVMAATLERLDVRIDLRALIAQALLMGDEAHNRNRAGSSLFLREIAPTLIELQRPARELADCVRFITQNDHFFLNLAMPAAKASADSAAGVAGSSIVTAMARNGTEFGIRLSGTGGDWFTGPASEVDGLYFPGYGPSDASRDLGDSTITETVGLGGFSMAAAPAIVGFVGGTAADALGATTRMYEIAWTESASYRIPALGFRGSPTAIDCREVVHARVLPVINTGIAHRDPGVGQIGAGLATPPREAFAKAVRALAARVGS